MAETAVITITTITSTTAAGTKAAVTTAATATTETVRLYPVEVDGKWGFIDKTGKVIWPGK